MATFFIVLLIMAAILASGRLIAMLFGMLIIFAGMISVLVKSMISILVGLIEVPFAIAAVVSHKCAKIFVKK